MIHKLSEPVSNTPYVPNEALVDLMVTKHRRVPLRATANLVNMLFLWPKFKIISLCIS